MTAENAIVLVVDDDPSARRAIERLLRSAGYEVESFASASEVLKRTWQDAPCCLVLDVQLPGLNGLDLQRTLKEIGIPVSVVFITGHGDIPMSVQAMKAGAVDFLPKPFDEQDLLDAVSRALRADQARSGLRCCYQSLTERERAVFVLVAAGIPNKQIGIKLGVVEKTVKVHRARVMAKMQAQSLADLVRMAGMFGMGEEADA